jgi:hypothetical protein
MKLSKMLTLFAVLITLSSSVALGQDNQKTIAEKYRIPDGSRIFVAKMERDLDQYITSEISKKKLPVTLVTNEQEADYVITGAALKGDTKWYQSVLGTAKDKNEGSIQVYSAKSRTMVWAGEAGDRSLFWGSLAKHGRDKVASRLVGKMKKELFWKVKK